MLQPMKADTYIYDRDTKVTLLRGHLPAIIRALREDAKSFAECGMIISSDYSSQLARDIQTIYDN